MKMILVLIAIGFAAIIVRLVAGEDSAWIARRRVGLLLCRVGGHRRSGSAVRKVEGAYLSRCRRCGTPLRKDGREGEWEVDAARLDPRRAEAAVDHA